MDLICDAIDGLLPIVLTSCLFSHPKGFPKLEPKILLSPRILWSPVFLQCCQLNGGQLELSTWGWFHYGKVLQPHHHQCYQHNCYYHSIITITAISIITAILYYHYNTIVHSLSVTSSWYSLGDASNSSSCYDRPGKLVVIFHPLLKKHRW